jgi:hypothetical protein
LSPKLRKLVWPLLALLPCLLAAPGQAVEPYTWTMSGLGGFGGSQDIEPGDGFGNRALQAGASLVSEPGVHLALRLGRITMDEDEVFGSRLDARVEYATLAGEYHIDEGFYDSGLFLGLGAYRLQGTRGGRDEEDTALGATVGVTGDFALTRRLSFVVELAGHWIDFDEAQLFGTGLAGLAFHF